MKAKAKSKARPPSAGKRPGKPANAAVNQKSEEPVLDVTAAVAACLALEVDATGAEGE